MQRLWQSLTDLFLSLHSSFCLGYVALLSVDAAAATAASTAVVALLRLPSSDTEFLAEAGLRAIGNLAVRDENSRLLGAVGACEGD